MKKYPTLNNLKPLNATKREIFSFCFNILLLLLGIFGLIFLFTIPLARGSGMEVANWTTFRYFTTDSNILAMLAVLIYCIYLLLIWHNKIKVMPVWTYVVKQIATLSVALTMFVTLFFLLPGSIITKVYPAASLYMGSNLFFHLINPLVAILGFLLFENRKDIKLKHTFWVLIPFVIYCVFYLIMAYTHMNPDGTFMKGYDWYKFCSFGVPATVGICTGLIGICYLFSWLFWFWNKKIDIKSINI